MQKAILGLVPLGATLVVVIGLAACSAPSTPDVAVFNTERTAEDALPGDTSPDLPLDDDSSRFLWADEDDAVEVYAAASDQDDFCLVIFTDDEPAGIAACSPTPPLEATAGRYRFGFAESSDDLLTPGDWNEVADSLYMR